jgi:hypothetical protein
MAHIHGTSGSTKYLLNGIKTINGKRLATLDELQHFYDHYEEILTETEANIARQQNEIILRFTNDESRLDKQLLEGIARRTVEVDKNINELNQKISAAGNFLAKTGYRLQYWVAVSLRNHRIHSPFTNLSIDLKNVRYQKAQRVNDKHTIIQKERNNVISSYNFLKTNETFLIGAQGEEAVINALSRLPDEYHVLNDINLHFHRAIHWREMNEYIKNCQIDHLVVGPTGIFLLETKNWKSSDIEKNSDRLLWQVHRCGFALWSYNLDYYPWYEDRPTIRIVVVSLNSLNTGRKLDSDIDLLPPQQLCDYILGRKATLSETAVKKFIDIVSRPRYSRPKF